MAPDGSIFSDFPDRNGRPSGRRLNDWILTGIHQACDQGDLEVATALLRILDQILRRTADVPSVDRRRDQDGLVAGYERVWELQHKFSDLAD